MQTHGYTVLIFERMPNHICMHIVIQKLRNLELQELFNHLLLYCVFIVADKRQLLPLPTHSYQTAKGPQGPQYLRYVFAAITQQDTQP